MALAAVVEGFLTEAQIPFAAAGTDRWIAQLRGERKLTIPVVLWVAGDALRLESFFMRKPQENREELYEILLRRNLRSYAVRFALDRTGDVYLTAQVPLDAVTAEELDRVAGALLIEADGMFDVAIEVGFASYLERDRAWRAAGGTEA